MKEGDIIIELAGKAITSVGSYNAVRATLKSDVEVSVRVLRDKKELTLKITPVIVK
jgi:S1-C subfamily serine protease